MNRREALRNVALLMGGAVSAATLSAIAVSCNEPDTQSKQLFTAEQEKTIAELADTIIPDTETPGAKAAGVGPFIAMMITDCYPAEIQKTFSNGLDDLEKRSKSKFSKSFVSISATERASVLQDVVDEEKKKREQEKGNAGSSATIKKDPGFFPLAKELTMLGYFSSEIGAKQALVYLDIPGRYDACTDLQPGQKAWAI
jgi:hypothetical protein